MGLRTKHTIYLGVAWWCGDQGQCNLFSGVHICKEGKESLCGEPPGALGLGDLVEGLESYR